MTYSHNAIDQVAAVRRAQVVVAGWEPIVVMRVADARPSAVLERDVDLQDWLVTVEILRQSYETPWEAANRVALYLELHAERWGETPTLKAIRRVGQPGDKASP